MAITVVYTEASMDGRNTDTGVDHVDITFSANAQDTIVFLMRTGSGNTFAATPITCTSGGEASPTTIGSAITGGGSNLFNKLWMARLENVATTGSKTFRLSTTAGAEQGLTAVILRGASTVVLDKNGSDPAHNGTQSVTLTAVAANAAIIGYGSNVATVWDTEMAAGYTGYWALTVGSSGTGFEYDADGGGAGGDKTVTWTTSYQTDVMALAASFKESSGASGSNMTFGIKEMNGGMQNLSGGMQ